MLIQFHFKNFKSFRDDTILDFSATESQDNEYRVAKVGDERILTAAGIFGAMLVENQMLSKHFAI